MEYLLPYWPRIGVNPILGAAKVTVNGKGGYLHVQQKQISWHRYGTDLAGGLAHRCRHASAGRSRRPDRSGETV